MIASHRTYIELLSLACPVVPLIDIGAILMTYVVYVKGSIARALACDVVSIICPVKNEMLSRRISVFREIDVVSVGGVAVLDRQRHSPVCT